MFRYIAGGLAITRANTPLTVSNKSHEPFDRHLPPCSNSQIADKRTLVTGHGDSQLHPAHRAARLPRLSHLSNDHHRYRLRADCGFGFDVVAYLLKRSRARMAAPILASYLGRGGVSSLSRAHSFVCKTFSFNSKLPENARGKSGISRRW